MVLLYEHWLVTDTTLIALVDSVMSVRGAPTTAAAVGATDTPLSNTTGGRGETRQTSDKSKGLRSFWKEHWLKVNNKWVWRCAYTIRAGLSSVYGSSRFILLWSWRWWRGGDQGMRVTLPFEHRTCTALQIPGTWTESKPSGWNSRNTVKLTVWWLCFRHTPDDVVHTVDLLIRGNVCLFPAFFRISDLRVGGCRRQTC